LHRRRSNRDDLRADFVDLPPQRGRNDEQTPPGLLDRQSDRENLVTIAPLVMHGAPVTDPSATGTFSKRTVRFAPDAPPPAHDLRV
jgi:hypothetical protein